MKKLLMILFLLCVNNAYSYEVDLNVDNSKSFKPAPIASTFGFVSAFYERIIFGFNIFESTDKNALQDITKNIIKAYQDGKKSVFIVKNYSNGSDLKFAFSNEVNWGDNIICISNYDSRNKKIIDSSSGSTWAFLLNNINGYFFDRRANENTEKKTDLVSYANDMLFDKNFENDKLIEELLLSEIDGQGEAFAFIVLAQYYFYSNNPEKGLDLLIKRKEEIFTRKKQNDFQILYDVTLEEGKAIQKILLN